MGIDSMLKPGKCRIIELSEECGVSRTTAEKLVQRYGLIETTISFNGREVSGVDLSEEDISKIAFDYPQALREISNTSNTPSDTQGSSYQYGIDILVEELRNRIAQLESDLSLKITEMDELSSKLRIAELESMEYKTQSNGKDQLLKEKDRLVLSKDEVISAKEQAINAANAAVMLMEQQKQTVDAEATKQLTGSQEKGEKRGWLDKILGR